MPKEVTIARENGVMGLRSRNAISGRADRAHERATYPSLNRESTIKSRINEFGGKLIGIQSKDGITGFAASFDYYDAKAFSKKYNYKVTTNVGDNYEFLSAEDYEKWRKKAR